MPTVTVIPSDHLVMVDGRCLQFTFEAPTNLHALQWDGSNGHMEWIDKGNTKITAEQYSTDVAPYVTLFEVESARLQKLEDQRIAEYNSYDNQCLRIREERDTLLKDTCDRMNPMRWDSLSFEQKKAWTTYRQALLDITVQDGFPWDGDVSKVPWPTLTLK